ncbi:MAG TPA: Xaa-Pro peptidase family protein [Solirubrobacteraceae bacterium]|nr:Xaa-Pro peptidase family protein [Solirubrobacteraceae bacterium]
MGAGRLWRGDGADVAQRAQRRASAGQRRIAAVREAMAADGLDLLVVLGSGRHSFIAANLCWWLSGLRQLGRDAAVLLPLDGEPRLIVTPSWDDLRARELAWIDDVTAVDDLPRELAGLLAGRFARAGAVGVAGAADASASVAAMLDAQLGERRRDGTAAISACARRHDEWALGLIAQAVQIAEAGFSHLCETARPGMREFELAALVDAHMRALGADDNFLLISASQHNRAVHAPTDRELWPGDVILAEISPAVEGQFAQICRTAVLGDATPALREGYALLAEAFAAGLRAAGPGVPVREVAGEVNRLVSERGYGRFTRPPYMRSRGHAMGLGAMVPADVSDSSDVVLEPGMSFVLHPNQYLPGPGYLLCGDQIEIADDGARALSGGALAGLAEIPVDPARGAT